MKKPALPRLETGVRNLDALLQGGLPKGSVSVFGGSPGAGKTILAQQICFHHARAKQERKRYLEVYKLRNTAHATGRHKMAIGPGGITVSPRGSKTKPPRKKPRRRS